MESSTNFSLFLGWRANGSNYRYIGILVALMSSRIPRGLWDAYQLRGGLNGIFDQGILY